MGGVQGYHVHVILVNQPGKRTLDYLIQIRDCLRRLCIKLSRGRLLQGGRAEKYCEGATQNCTNRHAASCPAVPSPLPIINRPARASKKSPGPFQTIGSHLEKPPNPCCTRFAHNFGLLYRFPTRRVATSHTFPSILNLSLELGVSISCLQQPI